MVEPKTKAQLERLNQALLAENETIKRMAQVAEDSLNTQNNMQGELYRQRGIIEKNIEKVQFSLWRTNKLTRR
jgi:hypothetical protein